MLELVSRNFPETAAGQLLFDRPQIRRAPKQFLFGENLFDGFEFQGARGTAAGELLTVPGEQGRFGDVQARGDAVKAQSLGAQFEEFAFCFGAVHEVVDS